MNYINYLYEFIGSLFFIFVVLSTGNPLIVGLTYSLIKLILMNLSGGHINPIISITMAVSGKLPIEDVFPYCVVQIFGGLFAYEIFKRIPK